MNQHKYRANVSADPSALPDHDLDDSMEGGIKKPLILVIVLHVVAVAGLLVFAKFNAYQATDAGDSANDYRYTEAVDPGGSGSGSQEAVGTLPENNPGDSRPLTHVVKSGELLPSIARRYGVDLQELAGLNDMASSDMPQPNRVLKIPQSAAATALMAGNDAGGNPADFRDVINNAPRAKPTSSPTEIDGVPVMRAQPVGGDAAAGATAPKPATPNGKSGTSYKVKPGDNLSKIARANGTTVEALKKANGITDPTKIQVGQSLKLP